MKNFENYERRYFAPPKNEYKWTKKEYIEHAPIWCSVDLRDGNQALTVPMSLKEKIKFFNLLVNMGFKQIEVCFPASSDTEYKFLRTLIEQKLIPDDVTIQVITQAREHIIKKTFDALAGVKRAIVHMYNSTSPSQRALVFRKDRDEIKKIACDGARLIKNLSKDTSADIIFEYTPESFSQTEPEFALDISNSVIDIWRPTKEKRAIINLPVTMEVCLPHIFANQIEYMSDNLICRDALVLSLHSHNDRGCSVADSELGLLAGAQRIEGTLFGNGERTGNVDIITLAMNMYSQGIDPGLDFSDLPKISNAYEHLTGMKVNPRQPYSGELAFAAFSGSHQDAIAKAMDIREKSPDKTWRVPYLIVDPADIGREYETDVIRINSQSGKGGVGYIMKNHFGYIIPEKMRECFGSTIKSVSDRTHKELHPNEIMALFEDEYINISLPLSFESVKYDQDAHIHAAVTVRYDGKSKTLCGSGNGRLDSVANALEKEFMHGLSIAAYEEHALSKGSTSEAVSYIGLSDKNGNLFWGAGRDEDIIASSIKALISAINKSHILL